MTFAPKGPAADTVLHACTCCVSLGQCQAGCSCSRSFKHILVVHVLYAPHLKVIANPQPLLYLFQHFFPCSSVKTHLLEKATVRCIETGEEKPLGTVSGKL